MKSRNVTEAGRTFFHEQRMLDLGETRIPWDGRSPRDLIESAIRFRLAPQGREPEYGSDAFFDEQCRRHHYGS